MKKLLFSFCFLLSYLVSQSQSTRQILDSVQALTARQQYLSAFLQLTAVKDITTDVIVSAASLINNHQAGFTLDFDQWRLEDKVNDKVVRSEYVSIAIEDMLWQAVTQFPTDCRIHKEIYSLYINIVSHRGAYLELTTLAQLGAAIEKELLPKCADYRGQYIVGYCHLANGNVQAAITGFQQAIAGNARFAPALQQLGKAYMLSDKIPDALKTLNTAFGLSTDRREKSQIALTTGQAYEAMKDNARALSSYLLADSLHRKEFFNQQALLNFYVKTNDERASQALKSFIGAQGRSSLLIYLDALDIYQKYNRTMDLAAYCQKALPQFKGYPEGEGAINFTLGIIYQNINEDMARQYLKRAKELGVKPDNYKPTRVHPFISKRIEDAYKWLG